MDTLVPSNSDSSGEEQSSSDDETEQLSFRNPQLKEDNYMDAKVAAVNVRISRTGTKRTSASQVCYICVGVRCVHRYLNS